MMVFLAVHEKRQAPRLFLMLLLAIILADQLPCGGRWSFPSAHAANAAAVAVVLTGWYPRWRIAFGVLAFLIGYSRIYVGVHYPLDVLGGWALGILCGIVVLQGTQWVRKRFLITASETTEEKR